MRHLPHLIKKNMKHFFLFVIYSLFTVSVAAQDLRVDFITPSIVRVRWGNDTKLSNNTGICVYPESKRVVVRRSEASDRISYTSSDLIVEINKKTQSLRFKDRDSKRILCAENPRNAHKSETVVRENIVYDEQSAHMEETANGKVTVKDILRRDTLGQTTKYTVSFDYQGDKALYGLGSHMEDYMNLKGKTLYLTQHNLKIAIPMLVSTNGYGLLFDAGCAMKYSPSDGDGFKMELDAAKVLDYYFIKGKDLGEVTRGYRYLTGAVSLLPRYMFGYIQSKERYVSSEDLINTVKEYRRRHVPIDMIVQDWNYWPEGWGYLKMNRKYYPDPKALADSIHAMNARLMVSIWSNPQYCPEEKDFRERGMMLEHSVYDAFNPEARKLYWSYVNDEFFSNGFDAWWCDSTEPVDGDWGGQIQTSDGHPYGWNDHEQRWLLSKKALSEALDEERTSLYSLYHSKGIYENQRATSSDKRVVNLTRSGYPGQQRYGTVVWNGDTHASWKSFRQQIPAGLNYMATGNPYWTVDVGCFFVRNDGRRWFYTGEFQDGVKDDHYKEFYTRMFQWATFLPVLRSHGSDTPREIWRFGDGQYYDAILKMIKLRYQLLPTLYSMAARTTFDGYTMARMLAFDFANDERVTDIKDEYMFGDMLVCPVTEPLATSREVYLPEGTAWTDFWTGRRYEGGKAITAAAPIGRLPLFVREGSIWVSGPVTEYSGDQYGKPYTIEVVSGKNASFCLYEDEGDNYDYEQGACSRIPISWDEKRQTLVIGTRTGSFPGMAASRQFTVKVDGKEVSTVAYDGKKTMIKK